MKYKAPLWRQKQEGPWLGQIGPSGAPHWMELLATGTLVAAWLFLLFSPRLMGYDDAFARVEGRGRDWIPPGDL